MSKYEVLTVFKHEGRQISASIVLSAKNEDKARYIVEYQLFPYKKIEIVEVRERYKGEERECGRILYE